MSRVKRNSIGKLFFSKRRATGKSVRVIAGATKLSVRTIRTLEENPTRAIALDDKKGIRYAAYLRIPKTHLLRAMGILEDYEAIKRVSADGPSSGLRRVRPRP